MADFRLDIGSGVKTIDIFNNAGELLMTKTINVGNKDELKKYITEFSKLESIEGEGTDVIDQLEQIEKKIIETTLGDWEVFWEASGENPIVLMHTLKALSGFLQEQLEGMYKGMA